MPTAIAPAPARSSWTWSRLARAADPAAVRITGREPPVGGHRPLRGQVGTATQVRRSESRHSAAARGAPGRADHAAPRSRPRAVALGRLPDVTMFGSELAYTTRRTPRSMITSVQGGVRPWWLHGSSDTYSVASARDLAGNGSPAARARRVRAPRIDVMTRLPCIAPSGPASTAPTTGFGRAPGLPCSASSIVRSSRSNGRAAAVGARHRRRADALSTPSPFMRSSGRRVDAPHPRHEEAVGRRLDAARCGRVVEQLEARGAPANDLLVLLAPAASTSSTRRCHRPA
jgi:hypothetical protein